MQRATLCAAFSPLLLLACTGHAAQPARPQPTKAPQALQVPRQLITAYTSDVEAVYAQAEAHARNKEWQPAAADYERAFRLDPEGPRACDALFRAAEARDLSGDNTGALERYEQVARRYPKHELAREALIRAVKLLAFLERWQRAGELADIYLASERAPRPFESIVAYSAKALALIERDDVERAHELVERARTVVENHGLDLAGKLPRELAQLYYALGEVRRIRAERIALAHVPPDFAAVLERRCQLILDAQSAYSDTMRAYDSHWSAMAGFRVGELYQRLHEELMRIEPRTAGNDLRKRQLFEGAMRLRYSVLLSKARGMMEHTSSMAERTGEHSAWVERADQASRDIANAEKAEQAALGRLPFTRLELEQALDRISKGAPP